MKNIFTVFVTFVSLNVSALGFAGCSADHVEKKPSPKVAAKKSEVPDSSYQIAFEKLPFKLVENAPEAAKKLAKDLSLANDQNVFKRVTNAWLLKELNHIPELYPATLKGTSVNHWAMIEGPDFQAIKQNLFEVPGFPEGEAVDFSALLEKVKSTSDIHQLKVELEKVVTNGYAPADQGIKYNKNKTSLFTYMTEKRMQCFSGTSMLQVAARSILKQAAFRERNFVTIHTPGHIQLGYLKKARGEWDLYAVESTVEGRGLMYYGPASQVQGKIHVVDAELYLLLQVFRDVTSDITEAATFAKNETAKRYGFDLSKVDTSADQGLVEGIFNTSPFGIKGEPLVSIPDEDMERVEADEIPVPANLTSMSSENLKHLLNGGSLSIDPVANSVENKQAILGIPGLAEILEIEDLARFSNDEIHPREWSAFRFFGENLSPNYGNQTDFDQNFIVNNKGEVFDSHWRYYPGEEKPTGILIPTHRSLQLTENQIEAWLIYELVLSPGVRKNKDCGNLVYFLVVITPMNVELVAYRLNIHGEIDYNIKPEAISSFRKWTPDNNAP